MYQPDLPKKLINHQRQEKLMAWSLTILLHLLLVGVGIYWYSQQKTSIPVKNPPTPTNAAAIPVASASPEPTLLQAQIDPSATPTTLVATQPITTKPISQLNQSSLSATTSTNPKTPTLQKSVITKIKTQPEINPNTPIYSDTKNNDFPVNGSTVTQTDIKTTPTAYGSITTTTTKRITTVAPEINQALTSRDISAKERRIMAQQTNKHLSANAKQADRLAEDLEKTNDATTQLIETVKRKNQASIDNDHTPIEK